MRFTAESAPNTLNRPGGGTVTRGRCIVSSWFESRPGIHIAFLARQGTMGCRAVPIAQIPQPGTGSSSPGGYGGPSSSMTLPFASIGSVSRCWSGTVFPNSSLDWHGAAATQSGGGLTYRIRLSVAIMQLLIGTDGRCRSLLFRRCDKWGRGPPARLGTRFPRPPSRASIPRNKAANPSVSLRRD